MATTARRKAEPARQHGEERPRVEAVEEDLEDAVESDQTGDVVRVALASSFQTSTMAMQRAMR